MKQIRPSGKLHRHNLPDWIGKAKDLDRAQDRATWRQGYVPALVPENLHGGTLSLKRRSQRVLDPVAKDILPI
jgi:hypothetical protein